MIGAVGPAMIFFFALITAVIVGLIMLSYAAHSFLVVVENTAAGDDDVRWPDEPIYDWLWKLWYLVWLVGFWFVPAWVLVDGVLMRVLNLGAVGVYPVLLAVVWLLFPISLFSSLSANSLLVVLRGETVRRLARQGLPLVLVWLIAGVLVIGSGVLSYFAIRADSWLLVPLAAVVGPVVLLVYARLLGRVGWLIGEQRTEKTRRRRKKQLFEEDERFPTPADLSPRPPLLVGEGEKDLSSPPPLAGEGAGGGVPPGEEDEWAPATPYVVQDGPPPVPARAPQRSPRPVDEESDPYRVREEEPRRVGVAMPSTEPSTPYDEPSAGSRLERRQLEPTLPPPPVSPLWVGVYNFPCYPSATNAWAFLAVLAFVLGLLLRLMKATWPFD
ncbi:MAG: hypothetical protein L0Z62_26360 [Gemmataceae bacterium]|nr:hypothetical protein [Gemmataceae bacterium]